MAFRHAQWTPRRMTDRLRARRFQRQLRRAAWLTPEALRFLETYLRPTDTLVEFGSGHSTFWLAQRVGRVATLEDLPGWCDLVRAQLDEAGINNVNCRLVNGDNLLQRADEALKAFPGGEADGALVCGLERDLCAVWALLHVRPGGLIVVEQASRYVSLPRQPAEVNGHAGSDLWKQFADTVAGWRYVRWADGEAEAVGYFKPAG